MNISGYLKAIGLVALGTSLVWFLYVRGLADHREKVFLEAWKLVDDNFYDRNMNGLNWKGVRDHYRPLARRSGDQIALYWNVIGPMLALLESSHVTASPAKLDQYSNVRDKNLLEVLEPSLSRCAGLTISTGRSSITSRVTWISTKSPVYKFGVRRGWRFLGINSSLQLGELEQELVFISDRGKETRIPLSEGVVVRKIDQELITKDVNRLTKLTIKGLETERVLPLNSLGMSLRVGQAGTLPFVASVENASDAERAGIEPGSEINELSLKQRGGNLISFRGRFRQTDGSINGADFNFRCTPTRARTSKYSKMITGSIVYIKFDQFRPDIVPWL